MRIHKSGKRRLGAFFDASFGSCYLAFRRPKDIFRGDIGREKKRSASQSLIEGDAMWAIDIATLMEARRCGVQVILVLMRPQRIVYYAPIESFLDPMKYRAHNYSLKGGSDQRYLPIKHFQSVDMSYRV